MKSILMFISDTFLREDTAEILKIEGFIVTKELHLKNLGIIKKNLPEIVMVDSDYPGINVSDILDYLRSDKCLEKILPIFIIPKQNNEIITFLKKSGEPFLTKPFSITELRNIVSNK